MALLFFIYSIITVFSFTVLLPYFSTDKNKMDLL